MKYLNQYLNEALIKKDTKIRHNLENTIFNYFYLPSEEKFLKNTEEYYEFIKEQINIWINRFNVQDIDGPYIYTNKDNYEYLFKYFLNHSCDPKNKNDYKTINYQELSDRLNDFNDYYNSGILKPDTDHFYNNPNNSSYLLGTNKRISYSSPEITNRVVIMFFVK